MSRHAVKLSLQEFKSLCEKKLNIPDEFDPYDLGKKVEKDLDKVQFDMENTSIGNAADEKAFVNYPCGYEVLENGLPVLFVNAGGDWEFPICFCLYWDGKHMRGYIPTNGNAYNKKEKCAFGSEESPDENLDRDQIVKMIDGDAIRKDVMERILIVG